MDSAQEPYILEKTAREFPKATLPNSKPFKTEKKTREFPKATLPNSKPFKTEKKAREFPKATQPHINIYIYIFAIENSKSPFFPNLKNLYSNS